MNKSIILTALVFLLSSCVSLPHEIKHTDCSRINDELDLRYYLFDKLSDDEIKRRSKIDVPSHSDLNHLSVFSKIVESVKNASIGSRVIAVDLRNYKDVHLGNIIITNYKNDKRLNLALLTTKYGQGYFVLINFGKDAITIVPNPHDQLIERQKIERSDLKNPEIVINVSDSRWIIGNMKFTPNSRFSLIADRIKKPYSLDLRENSNIQFHLDEKWIMPVYSIEGSDLHGGKDTSGFFQFVNNKRTKRITLTKFYKSQVACYKDENGLKFK